MARDDFFLSFGTDADVFANKIESESARASQAILHLTEALEDYDGTVRNAKSGGPLQNLFGALDQAAGQFGRLTSELSSSLGAALQGISGLKDELSGLVAAVNEVNIARERARGKGGPTKPPVLEVTDDEIVATNNARRAGRYLGEVIELNAREARNALKRVADINATVGRNSNTAADGVKELARQIRELSGAAKEAQGRGTIGQIAGVPGGGITITGPVTFSGDGVGLAQIAPNAPVAQKAQGPVTDQQADAVVRAEAKRRRSDPIPIDDLSGVAAPGLYSHPSVEGSAARRGGRLVGADVREGETFQQYFARNDATRAHIEASRQAMPKPEHADLADFRQFKLSGGKVAEQLEEKWMRTLEQDKHSSAITAEGIKASLTDLGLEQQYPGLPQIIERVLQTRAAQREHAEKAIRELLAQDPHTTFGGGALGVQNSDFEIGNTYGAALHKVDEDLLNTHEGNPAAVAAAQARRDAAEKRRLYRFSSGDTAVPLSNLTPAPGTAEQEGMTVAARRKADAATRKAARDANAAFVASLDPIDQAAVSERRKGNPELQRINAILGKNSLNVGEIAETLGLEARDTRRPAVDEAALQRAALEREQARTRLEAFQANPEIALAQERARLAAREASEQGLHRSAREYPTLPGGRLVTAANLTPETLQEMLHQNIAQSTRAITGLTTLRDYPGLTDDSQAEARERLENRRAQILEETARGGPSVEEAFRRRQGEYNDPEGQRATSLRALAGEHVGGDIQALTDALHKAGTSDRPLFRGVGDDGTFAGLKPGEHFQLPLSSFSADEHQATEYSRHGQKNVLFELEPGAKALSAPTGPNAEGLVFDHEQEALSAGHFEVLRSVWDAEEELYRVHIRALGEQLPKADSAAAASRATPSEEHDRLVNTAEIVAPTSPSSRRPNRGRLTEARERLAELRAAEDQSDEALQGEIAALEEEIDKMAAARAPKTEAGGAGAGGGKPPLPPNAAAEADDEEPTPRRQAKGVFDRGVTPNKTNTSTSQQFKQDYSEQIALLKPLTREILANAAARLQDTRLIADETQRIEAQNRILVEAGAAFKSDPHFKNFPNLPTARGTFAQALAMPPSKDNYNRLQGLFTQGGGIDASGLVNKATTAASAPSKAPGANEPGGTLGKALFGQRGFLDSQLRHVGLAIENFAGFQLVFSGFEKLKELVETGLQTDVTFVRLKATLDATGRSAIGLRSAFSRISSETGEDLKKVVEAGAELAGVYRNNADLVKGVEVAAQLANISQGTLTAKDAAIGLRDVTDAYAVSGSQSIQRVGDQIARLSVITGVTVKDITEGATQLAQEAHEFGLTQRQAVTLTAFVTKSTGESGEQAAEQTSRLVSTLNTTKVQDLLVRLNVATREQFAEGDVGGVLTNLIKQFDNLTPSARQAISSLIGAGRQARAFTGLVRDGDEIVKEFNNTQDDLGALARQNTAILGTTSGQIKKMSEDFRNLGQTLQQLGVFDILGVVAKSVDLLLRSFNYLGQHLADFFNSNPILKNFKDLTMTVLELVVAFKVLGPIASSVMGKMGLGAAGAAARAEAAAVANGGTPGVAGAGARAARGRGYGGFFTPALVGPVLASDVASRRLIAVGESHVIEGAGPEGRGQVAPRTPRTTMLQPIAQPGLAGFGGRAVGAIPQGVGRLGSALGRGLSGIGDEDSGRFVRGIQRVGAVSESAGTKAQNLGTRIQTLGETSRMAGVGMAALSGALTAFMVLLPFVIEGFEKTSQRKQELSEFLDSQTNDRPVDENKEDPTGVHQQFVTQQKRAQEASNPGVAERIKDVVFGGAAGTSGWSRPHHIANTLSFGILGAAEHFGRDTWNPLAAFKEGNSDNFGSQGMTSEKFDKDYFKLLTSQTGRLRATKGKGTDAVVQAQKENDKEYADRLKGLVEEAGDEAAQQQAALELASLHESMSNAADRRLQIEKGLNLIDVMNAKQIVGLGEITQYAMGLSKQTLAQVQPLLAAMESDRGIVTGSRQDLNFKTAMNPEATARARRQANIANLQDDLAQGQDKLSNNELYAAGPARDALITSMQAQAGTLAQLQQQELQSGQALGAARADFLARAGNPMAAVAAMKESVTGIIDQLRQFDSTQPEFFQALASLMDAEQKTADLATLPAINKLKLNSSRTLNAVTHAEDAAKVAQQQYNAAKAAAAESDPAMLQVAQEKVDQAKADLTALTTAGVSPTDPRYLAASDKAVQAAKDYAAMKAQSGPDNPNVVAARIAKNEADLAARQARQDQYQSGVQLTAATMENAANQAGADAETLRGLQGKGGALESAIALYGENSQQANAIRIQIIQQKKKYEDDLLDILNASLDLDIATLEARGQSGDAERAAADRTQEAQNAVDSYKKRTGDTSLSNPEGKRLQAALISQKRAQFDTALQAQLDTLDFQKETYQITSNQEIQALQEILKNKQLTLKEQRDITLKIKNLQEQVRNQLTGSGFNIPTDIKLPTAYAVRRSLGLNPMNTSGTASTNYSTNVVNHTVLNNTVSSPAMVHAIATKVVDLINTQTATATRSNQTSPALVRY